MVLKFTCSQQNLSYGLNQVQKAVSTRNTLPILLGIKIQTGRQELILQATDLEMAIECRIAAEIEEEGEVVLPAKYFVDIIRNLPGTIVSAEMNEDNYYIKIKAGKAEFNLHGQSAEEFPAMPIIERDKNFSVSVESLKNTLYDTQFAVSHDESRPVFTGILIESKSDKLIAVATDGYRLAIKYSDIPWHENLPPVIVPGKAAAEIHRLLSGKGFEDVQMQIINNQIIIQFTDTILVSRLIDGQFPNYQQIIPKTHPLSLELDREEFLRSLERVGLITKDGPNIVRIHVTQDEKMVITARSPEIGDTYDEIIIPYQESELKIAFNVKYLTDVLKVISEDRVLFSLTEELKPATIRPAQGDDYRYIVLPVRLPQ
jgi:DNA polymerase III subunit beta